MAKVYVTFGNHMHTVNGKTFDKDCVAVIECRDWSQGRYKALQTFGSKFCFCYFEDEFKKEFLKYFSRGLIDV